jgi:hypothetical protein
MAPPWTVGSPKRAAARLSIITEVDPMRIVSGGPTQVSMSLTLAAGSIPITVVVLPGGRIGPPTWGTSTVTMGQTCMSVIRAAGGIWIFPSSLLIRQYIKLAAGLAELHFFGLGKLTTEEVDRTEAGAEHDSFGACR